MAQQAKMAAMGEMIENIAHQWRQPLSMVTALVTTSLVERELNLLSEEELRNKLYSIKDVAEHLSKTIDDFRSFFKPNKEKVEIDLSKTIEKALQLINPKLKDNSIEIYKDIESISFLGLENELIQVIINLINNAKDILESKQLSRKFIFIDVKKQKNRVTISIKDNGGGIKEDILNRIFEPYFTTKHKSQGTGIGLYMSRVIMSKHMDGDINVENVEYVFENEVKKGALFKIVFPI